MFNDEYIFILGGMSYSQTIYYIPTTNSLTNRYLNTYHDFFFFEKGEKN